VIKAKTGCKIYLAACFATENGKNDVFFKKSVCKFAHIKKALYLCIVKQEQTLITK